MKKFALSLALASVLMTPVTVAEDQTPIEVVIEYDTVLLETEAGAKQLMDSIADQAREACRRPVVSFYGGNVDDACVAQVVAEAAQKISDTRAAAGLTVPRQFAALADSERQ